MQLARPPIAIDPRRFGRGIARTCAESSATPALSNDLKLFTTTFAAGFLFVSVFLA